MYWLFFAIPCGYLIILYNEKIGDMIGSIDFAERAFGAGGTYLFLKIAGFCMIVFGFIVPLGGCDSFLQESLGPLTGNQP